ncbi:glycosyltransferase family 2 protein [Flavobacterium soyangense]|uniref:Glycosyltransferase family 2 protein n=1 Tax=Flavobacterium soyangense TaxID=2023265 RepID=A0A930U779_9FLAO|nr:glycosyltransferase family 2 protein [Flavobacterium soyangense]MBF2708188.1 glycosyltransferase family 2 protein [Flavobacterium soyangense]
MEVSIIIVNYNTLALTQSCINSVFEYTLDVSFEIIVIDNNSHDGSQAILALDNRITFIESDLNLGFGKANNLGINVSKGNYVFFLNSDTYLLNDAISKLWKFCEERKNEFIGAVGCLLIGDDGQRCHSYAKLPSAFDILKSYAIAPFASNKAKQILGIDNSKNESELSFEVGYVTGADLFLHKSVLDNCGQFDSDFFMYSEEVELQWRFKSAGYKNVIINGPQIVHLEGASMKVSEKISMNKIIMIQKSLFLLITKTSSLLTYYIFRYLFAVIRIPFLILSNYSFKDKTKYLSLLFS